MKTVSIWWNDKRIKGKFYLSDLVKPLLEILEQHKADKIEIKYPHNSIDTYTRQELLSITEQEASSKRIVRHSKMLRSQALEALHRLSPDI